MYWTRITLAMSYIEQELHWLGYVLVLDKSYIGQEFQWLIYALDRSYAGYVIFGQGLHWLVNLSGRNYTA